MQNHKKGFAPIAIIILLLILIGAGAVVIPRLLKPNNQSSGNPTQEENSTVKEQNITNNTMQKPNGQIGEMIVIKRKTGKVEALRFVDEVVAIVKARALYTQSKDVQESVASVERSLALARSGASMADVAQKLKAERDYLDVTRNHLNAEQGVVMAKINKSANNDDISTYQVLTDTYFTVFGLQDAGWLVETTFVGKETPRYLTVYAGELNSATLIISELAKKYNTSKNFLENISTPWPDVALVKESMAIYGGVPGSTNISDTIGAKYEDPSVWANLTALLQAKAWK